MKRCDDCRYRQEPEYNKPCVVYRDDCPLYEKEGEEMTNKEAIEELKAIKSEYSNKAFGDSRLMRSEIEALDRAIKALEQEPYGDLISRQAVLDGIEELKQSPWFNDDTHEAKIIRKEAVEIVEDLCVKQAPPVNPQEPTKEEQALLQKWRDNRGISIEDFEDAMNALQEPKTGHWKRVSIEKYVQHAMAFYVCSDCGKDTIGEPKFCPNCGARMESEDK